MIATNYTKGRLIFYHFIAWMIYGIYFYLVNRLTNDHITPFDVLVSLPFYALVCYTVYYILTHYFRLGHYLMGTAHLLAFYIAFGFLAHAFVYRVGPELGVEFYDDDADYSHAAFFQTILVLLGRYSTWGFAYYLIKRIFLKEVQRREAAEQQYEKSQALVRALQENNRLEYIALSGQVSPHIQANLFNKWWVQIKRDPEKVIEELDKSHKMMEYYMFAHNLSGDKTVTLKKEIKYLDNYIELYRSSVSHTCYILADYDKNFGGFSIPPTTLLTLFENTTKHGVLNDPQRPVELILRIHKNCFYFKVVNVILPESPFISHGVGLTNLKRRLILHYGNRCKLKNYALEDEYFVELTIPSELA